MGSRRARLFFILLTACFLVSTVFPATPESLEERALEAMAEGRYDDATPLLEKVLQSRPENRRALYNLACCLSRSGKLEAAAKQLEVAWKTGPRNIELLRTDPDLENLRASRQGGALIIRLIAEEEQVQRLRGKPQFFQAPMLGGLRVVTPRQMEDGRKYPLVLILHGHGATPEGYAGMFEQAGAEIEAIIAAPYGPYPIALQQGHGYSWYQAPWLYRDVLTTGGPAADRDARRSELNRTEQAVTDRYVLAAIDAVKDSYPVDEGRIFLMGHSEGGAVAFHLGLKYPDVFQGLITIGAYLRDSDASEENLAAAAGRIRVLICHSRQDAQMEFAHARLAQKAMKTAGIESRLAEYLGGHGLSHPLIRTIDRWIRKH